MPVPSNSETLLPMGSLWIRHPNPSFFEEEGTEARAEYCLIQVICILFIFYIIIEWSLRITSAQLQQKVQPYIQ